MSVAEPINFKLNNKFDQDCYVTHAEAHVHSRALCFVLVYATE